MMKTLCAGLSQLSFKISHHFDMYKNDSCVFFVLAAGIKYIPPSKCLLPVLGKTIIGVIFHSVCNLDYQASC